MTATRFSTLSNPIDCIAPEALERGIHELVPAYQCTRSTMLAWFVARCAQALCHHPDFEGSDEERCAWRRLAAQWRMLACTDGCAVAPGAVSQ